VSAAAAATFSLDAATSSDAKERGKDTVMEDTVGRFLVVVGKCSDVGTARRSTGGDDSGARTARLNTGGDNGPATLSRRRITNDATRRGDMRRTVDEDRPPEVTTANQSTLGQRNTIINIPQRQHRNLSRTPVIYIKFYETKGKHSFGKLFKNCNSDRQSQYPKCGW